MAGESSVAVSDTYCAGRHLYSTHMLWSASLQYAHALAEMPLSVKRALGCDPGLFAHSEASMKASCLFGEFPSTESQESQNL